jgi:prephenate dehydrogenase
MKIAIIGGYGQMGAWFAEFFKSRGDTVTISGRDYTKCLKAARKIGVRAAKTNADAVIGADLIVISVLIGNFKKVVRELAPSIREGQKVIDLTSLKVLPVRIMHRYLGGATVLGTHPMFGPSAKAKGQNFVLTPTNPAERRFAGTLGKMLRGNGFKVRIMSPAKHDRMIGAVLSLTHFVGLVTADTWKELRIERYMDTSSTSFRFLLQFAKSVADSNSELYAYLQMDVPRAAEAESVFVRRSKIWAGMVRRRQRRGFRRRMEELSAYLNALEA